MSLGSSSGRQHGGVGEEGEGVFEQVLNLSEGVWREGVGTVTRLCE